MFPHDAEKGYAAVVVAVAHVTLVPVNSDYVVIPQVLRLCAFSPTLAEDLVQFLDEGSLGKFHGFRGNAVFSWAF